MESPRIEELKQQLALMSAQHTQYMAEARAQIAAKDAEIESHRKEAAYWHARYAALAAPARETE